MRDPIKTLLHVGLDLRGTLRDARGRACGRGGGVAAAWQRIGGVTAAWHRLDAIAATDTPRRPRRGPNGPKFGPETTHFMVRWTRVASTA